MIPSDTPNDALAALMREAGVTNKGLARLVREHGASHGLTLRCTHTTVKRWLAGTPSRTRGVPEVVAEVLTRLLGRQVTPADAGMAPRTANRGTAATADPTTSPWTLLHDAEALCAADTGSHPSVDALLPATALAAPVLRWVISPPPAPPARPRGARAVGRADVDRILATARMVRQLDNQFGGGAARTIAVHHLRADVLPLLHGGYTAAVGRELFRAAAIAAHRVGHITYDAGRHAAARRYLLLAVALAHHADDRPLAAKVLGILAHQATFLGEYREALDFVRAGRAGAPGATPAGHAALWAMEARAHAALGDRRATREALGHAERSLAASRPGEEPEWLAYFTPAELADETAHCLLELGDAPTARAHARAALSGRDRDEYARSTVFTGFVLARSHLLGRDVEQACATALTALPTALQVRSVRTRAYLNDFLARLAPFERVPAVRDLRDRHHALTA
ncbi:helix-turn-helix domain-containing protein [Allostreptomyces psammosilenae]|uniref:Tetratricopeptide (TPR) repeat protein n=1 Tax=Allostreptomyces psammosilenae TaxID=1892865 RepID=A0A852ZTY0_9ACTN|nr:helix-turn-helix domain-containing protein [Allostreptomyces psammosilenae]NYI04740.1 tetratricopeptide (TPR) repeat protein [Allostreptomyces psammosilenae]